MKGSRLPFPRNPDFTGREGDLAHVAQSLLQPEQGLAAGPDRVAIVAGPGGAGKSGLAVEFCYRYGQRFNGVHWLNASLDPLSEMAACGELMNLPDWPATVPAQARRTRLAWASSPPRLIVLDHVQDPALVAHWLPRLPGVALLVTSRSERWPASLAPFVYPLAGLEPSEALELLLKLAPRLKSAPVEVLQSLVQRLENQPAAINLAGRHLAHEADFSPGAYVSALTAERGEAVPKALTPASPNWALPAAWAAFAAAWHRLASRPGGLPGRDAFCVCGYSAPSVPLCLDLIADVARLDSRACESALSTVQALGWLEMTHDGLCITPLIAECARWAGQQENKDTLRTVVESWRYLLSYANPDGPLRLNDANRAHLRAICDTAETHRLKDLGELWHALGRQLETEDDLDLAKTCFRGALKNDLFTYGPAHMRVGINLTHLAEIARRQGDPAEALDGYEQALHIFENILEPGHPLITTVVTRLEGLHARRAAS